VNIIPIQTEWKLSFEFIIHETHPIKYTNVIHCTTGENIGNAGTRIPAMWIHPKSNQIFIQVYDYETNLQFEMNAWQNLKIVYQKYYNRVYEMKIFWNGGLRDTRHMLSLKDFKNVKCYVCDPWHANVRGFLRNLEYTQLLEGI